ncbi:transposase [Edaphobacter paludis]|uniref:Transposase n=1 Tax=Edaphobacter paludis TaxID=3035702 RepID=A0AAU7CVS8_9BACT
MAIPSRASRPGTFFVTSGTYNRRRLFQVERNAELLVETLQHYRAEGHYKLHAFVVMPDHLHLLLTPQETLERAVGLIKGGFSHRLASKLPVWQRGFTDHRIRDAEDYSIRHRYIHQNPVTARLCEQPEAYRFSSAHSALRLDAYSAVEEAGTVPQGLKPHES